MGTVPFKSKSVGSDLSTHKTSGETECVIYRAVNGRPDENISKVVELFGGIENFIGRDDVIVIKPNVQWWNQGAPNLSTLKTFIDLIMNRFNGFHGEVVMTENCHRGHTPWESLNSGWRRSFVRNSDLDNIVNYNDLSEVLKRRYGDRFSTCHWIDVDSGSKRVYGPADGPGYVYCDGSKGVPLISFDNGIIGEHYRAVIMSYPIFETDKGTIIDFKNGIWAKGVYTNQPLKFINFAALNHHSSYCGATSAVKNYLGVPDLSGGSDPANGGKLIENYYNFHSFPFDGDSPGPASGMLGSQIGVFMNTIRKADLNITTAEWVGLASRTDPPVAYTKAVLASKDPVALDYHATKYLLYPNSKIALHNPDNKDGPLYQYLKNCAEIARLSLDESNVEIKSWDFKSQALQEGEKLTVMAHQHWGSDLKTLVRYAIFRWVPSSLLYWLA
jgi:hypothetical protein